jgi:hypothetical protein
MLGELIIRVLLRKLIILVMIMKGRRLVVDHLRFDELWEISINGLNHWVSVQIICFEHKLISLLASLIPLFIEFMVDPFLMTIGLLIKFIVISLIMQIIDMRFGE